MCQRIWNTKTSLAAMSWIAQVTAVQHNIVLVDFHSSRMAGGIDDLFIISAIKLLISVIMNKWQFRRPYTPDSSQMKLVQPSLDPVATTMTGRPTEC